MTATATVATTRGPVSAGPRSPLEAYKRHARRFGPCMVFETAREDRGMTIRQLAQLVGYLRGLPPYRVLDAKGRLVQDGDWSTFRLSRDARDTLIGKLIEAGEPAGFIVQKLGVSSATVQRVRDEGGDDPKTASKPQYPRAARNSNGDPKGIALCCYCGVLFAQPTGRGRPRKFCCEEHRRAHQAELRQAGAAG
jgi:hypothetical protein